MTFLGSLFGFVLVCMGILTAMILFIDRPTFTPSSRAILTIAATAFVIAGLIFMAYN